VALARALAREARLLLLDEPFSALDEALRSGLRHELLRLRAELGLTIVFVTHDLREAHLLADRLAVFDEGRILQFGPRETVFRQPASRRVAELTGVANVLPGRVEGREGGMLRVAVAGLVVACHGGDHEASPGEAVDLAIRAERVNLRRLAPDAETPNLYRARIVEEFAYGASHTLHLAPLGPGPAIEVEMASRPYDVLGIATQKEWTVELPPADIHVMPASR
jgi:ABC-type Fe3+/spermidine/putrescine transport system ATPase subunit